MITELYEKLKSSYVGSILGDFGGLFSRKRLYSDDSSDEDDDPILIEPPFKRSRPFQGDVDYNLMHEGLPSYNRSQRESDFQARLAAYSSFSNINNLKSTMDKGNPNRTHISTPRLSLYPDISNKENKSKQTEHIEYLGISSKPPSFHAQKFYGRGMQKDFDGLDTGHQSPFASMRFSPSVTSTVDKSGLAKLHVAKRKPIKSSHLSSGIEKVLSRTPTKTDIKKKSSDIYRFKNRPTKSIIESIMPSIGPFLTAKQSYRLEDRERYRQVLQQFTTCDVTSRNSWKKSLFSSFNTSGTVFPSLMAPSSGGAIIKTHLDPISTSKSRKKWERCEKMPTPSLPHSRLKALPSTSIKTPIEKNGAITVTDVIPLIDLEADVPKAKASKASIEDDDEIIITKEIKPPKKIQSSLETHLHKSPFYSDDWLKNFRQYYKDKKSETDADVQVIYETKKLCEESRQACKEQILDKVARRMSQMDIKYPTKVVELKDEVEEEFVELTPEMEHVIQKAFKGGPPGQVLADKFNIKITRKDLYTLAGLNWLNDEVINFYMNMLMERGKTDNYPSVYAFNTFFYSKLVKNGYASVKRWTKKIDIFSSDLLIIPVHLGMHWCLSVIDLRNKSIRYYDSMLGDNYQCLAELKNYLISEHEDKKKTPYDVSCFSVENIKDIPQQMNGSDCGMFSCKFAEYLSRDASITFSQEHMPYFRKRMVYEIVTQQLL